MVLRTHFERERRLSRRCRLLVQLDELFKALERIWSISEFHSKDEAAVSSPAKALCCGKTVQPCATSSCGVIQLLGDVLEALTADPARLTEEHVVISLGLIDSLFDAAKEAAQQRDTTQVSGTALSFMLPHTLSFGRCRASSFRCD